MNPLNAIRDVRTIKQLLTEAERLAREFGEEQPAAEHLLLAAMDLPDGTGRRILGRFGVDADGLRGAITAQHASALAAAGIDRGEADRLSEPRPVPPADRPSVYQSAPSAQEVFQAAGALARSSKERLAGAHVVAAVAAMEHGTAARILETLGIDRGALAAAAAEERGRLP